MRINMPQFIVVWLLNRKEKAKANEIMSKKRSVYWDA